MSQEMQMVSKNWEWPSVDNHEENGDSVLKPQGDKFSSRIHNEERS